MLARTIKDSFIKALNKFIQKMYLTIDAEFDDSGNVNLANLSNLLKLCKGKDEMRR